MPRTNFNNLLEISDYRAVNNNRDAAAQALIDAVDELVGNVRFDEFDDDEIPPASIDELITEVRDRDETMFCSLRIPDEDDDRNTPVVAETGIGECMTADLGNLGTDASLTLLRAARDNDVATVRDEIVDVWLEVVHPFDALEAAVHDEIFDLELKGTSASQDGNGDPVHECLLRMDQNGGPVINSRHALVFAFAYTPATGAITLYEDQQDSDVITSGQAEQLVKAAFDTAAGKSFAQWLQSDVAEIG